MSGIEHVTSGAEKLGIGHSSAVYDREVILTRLYGGVPLEIAFTKADGTHRVMVCTLNPIWIPIELVARDPGHAADRDPDTVTVWDIGTAHWKAIRLDRILTIKDLE